MRFRSSEMILLLFISGKLNSILERFNHSMADMRELSWIGSGYFHFWSWMLCYCNVGERCWWKCILVKNLYDGEKISQTSSPSSVVMLMKSFVGEYVWSIENFSPTYFFNNIFHQHHYTQMLHVTWTMSDF